MACAPSWPTDSVEYLQAVSSGEGKGKDPYFDIYIRLEPARTGAPEATAARDQPFDLVMFRSRTLVVRLP
jgi:hypothetical protein